MNNFCIGILVGSILTLTIVYLNKLMNDAEQDNTPTQGNFETDTETTIEIFKSSMKPFKYKKNRGEFIEVNKVEQFLKEANGDISLGTVITDIHE